ncbi:DUF4252 domain-containing protein [bacterium]|nr:DUF4252 domain-containing protein [bacterium]
MKRTVFLTGLLSVIFIVTGLFAQDTDITRLPGYINLEKIKIPKSASEITDISIGPGLLKLLSGTSSDSSMKKGISGIMSIRVKSFEIDDSEAGKLLKQLQEIIRKVEKDKWESIVKVKSKDEFTNISVKMNSGKPVGLLILSYEAGDKVTLVNVCGKGIDLNAIKNMGMDLGGYEDKLDSLDMNF